MTARTTVRTMALLLGAALALLPGVLLAHGETHEGGVETSAFAETAGVGVLVGSLGLPYATGLRRLWANAGWGHGIRAGEAAAFLAGLGILAAALLAPAYVPLTDEFSGHMGQHLLILVVAAPLLAFGRAEVAFAWAFRGTPLSRTVRAGHRARATRWLRAATSAPALLAVYVAVVWTWHLPALYDLASRHQALHAAEHASMLAVAGLFWWRVRTLETGSARRQVGAFFLLFAAVFPELALGAFITFAREPLYESHALATTARGGDPGTDQQLGGLVMLMLGGLVYLGVALAVMLRYLSRATTTPMDRGWEP